jgi:hypothetical protein
MRFKLMMILVAAISLAGLSLGAGWSANNIASEPVDSGIEPTNIERKPIDIERLADAIILVESDGKVNCRGRLGERGLMQIRRSTWRWVCKKLLHVNWSFDRDGFDYQKNLLVGKAYLSYLSERLQSEEAVICAYNCGITKYLNHQVPPFTLDYLERVRNLQRQPDTPHFPNGDR